MQNSFISAVFGIFWSFGTLLFSVVPAKSQDEQKLEQDIDRVIRIFSDDLMTNKDFQFVHSVPKEVIPLLIRRLEKDRLSVTKFSTAYDLIAYKLQQFEGEIPESLRKSAIRLMVETCESSDNEIALMYILGFRKVNDPEILAMARRMKDRPDINLQKATARLLESYDETPPSTPVPALSGATTRVITTPTSTSPSTAVGGENPAQVVEEKSPLWPWVVGILALLSIATIALKRRT
jgi:hypothetical protein